MVQSFTLQVRGSSRVLSRVGYATGPSPFSVLRHWGYPANTGEGSLIIGRVGRSVSPPPGPPPPICTEVAGGHREDRGRGGGGGDRGRGGIKGVVAHLPGLVEPVQKVERQVQVSRQAYLVLR